MTQERNAKQLALLSAAVAVCAALPFLQAISFPFLIGWDDNSLVNDEQHLVFSLSNILYWLQGNYSSQIVPATFLTFMGDYAVDGLNPAVFHAQNILWHAVASIGVFFCFTLFRVRLWLAFAMAVVYAVHPQKVESVVWVIERKDLVYGAFAAWSFYFYARTSQAARFAPLSLCLFALSLMAKPTAMTLPLILLAFEFSRARPFDFKAMAFRLAPFFALSALVYLNSCAPMAHMQKPLLEKAAIIAHNFLWYPESFFAPWDLLPLYPPVDLSRGALTLVALQWAALAAFAAVLFFKKREFLLWKALPFAACVAFSLSLTSGVVQFSGADFADRYNYMPSAFYCFAAAWLLSRLLDWDELQEADIKLSRVLPAALVVVALGLGWTSFNYAKTFTSVLALFSTASAPARPNPAAPCLLAITKFNLGVPAADDLLEKIHSAPEVMSANDAPGILSSGMDAYITLKALEEFDKAPSGPAAQSHLDALKRMAKVKRPLTSLITESFILNALLERQIMTNRTDAALETLDSLIEVVSRKNPLYNSEGQARYYSGLRSLLKKDYKEAKEKFEAASKLMPGSALIRDRLNRASELMLQESTKSRACDEREGSVKQ